MTVQSVPITATPIKAEPAAELTVAAKSGFGRTRLVTLGINGAGVGHATTAPDGSFSGRIIVPALLPGSVTVTAANKTARGSVPFTVLPVPVPPQPTYLLDEEFGGPLDPAKWYLSPNNVFHCCGTRFDPVKTPNGVVVGYDGPVRLPGDGFGYFDAVRDTANPNHWRVPIISSRQMFGINTHWECLLRSPVGHGGWPAFWGYAGGWEIDATEILANPVGSMAAGHDVRSSHVHVHWGNLPTQQLGATIPLSSGAPLSDDFHLYGFERFADHVDFFLDGAKVWTFDPTDKTQVPQVPLPAILNLGVGASGDWPGPADASTPSPLTMVAGHVRIWAL